MRAWIKNHAVQIIAVITVASVVAVPFIINESYMKNAGYITVWDGADLLAYFGAIVSAVGTIVLGVIAWQQNTRLLKLEENTFLASNAGSALLTDIAITGIESIAVNLKNHEEQIVLTENAEKGSHPLDYGSIEMACILEPLDKSQHISLVNVKSVLLIASKDNGKTCFLLFAKNDDTQYTKVAISKDNDRFMISLIMSRDEKQSLLSIIDNLYSELQVEIELTIMTTKYVATELKCRATLNSPNYTDKAYDHFKTSEDNPPMCFWNGASVAQRGQIKIKTVHHEQ